MEENERITAIYLGALLLDGIIPANLKVIKRTIESLKRAAAHIDSARPMQEHMARYRDAPIVASSVMLETPPADTVGRVPSAPTSPVFMARMPKSPKSQAQRRKEALDKSKLEPPDSPDDSPPSAS